MAILNIGGPMPNQRWANVETFHRMKIFKISKCHVESLACQVETILVKINRKNIFHNHTLLHWANVVLTMPTKSQRTSHQPALVQRK